MTPNQPITLTLSPSPDGRTWNLAVDQSANGAPARKFDLVPDGDSGLFRAVAARDLFGPSGTPVVRRGERSGQIWGGQALSQNGSCWVYPHAKVLSRGAVSGEAQLYDEVVVSDHGRVSGSAVLSGSVTVSNYGHVYGGARVSGGAQVRQGAQVCGDAIVQDNVVLRGDVHVSGGSWYDNAKVDTRDSFAIIGGRFVADMIVTDCRDYLQVNTCWGALNVARMTNNRWLGTVGCQRFTSFAALERLAANTASPYEIDQLEDWFGMMLRLFQHWGLPSEVIERTTVRRGTED